MSPRSFFFAGGGTGGHIYPAIAVAEKIKELSPDSHIHFFCSNKRIDKTVLEQTPFESTELPAKGFSIKPKQFLEFISAFKKSTQIARAELSKSSNSIVIGCGGFVAAPVCWAAKKNNIPVKLINVDIVPGRANKLLQRFADEIFLQFEDTKKLFKKTKAKIRVTGCPLRGAFINPKPQNAIDELGLDKNKNILLVTGASSGAQNINDAVCSLLDELNNLASDWQIVHLTGKANFEKVQAQYAGAYISHKIVDYYHNMADLLAASDLLIGRSGAVSIAEFAASGLPCICMPYPYHKDRHQYLNAEILVNAGAAIVVDDLPDARQRCEWLAEELLPLMKDGDRRKQMAAAAENVAKKDAAEQIAKALLGLD
jgi:UDP-N-acetylglucosamine--N-acetylmuramyl-(pentapeptide) pyrophosphoryl-undecaprenol N-acetylglucosamine transferase